MIYLDAFFLLNFLMDFLVAFLTEWIRRRNTRWKKLVIWAIAAAGTDCICLIVALPELFQTGLLFAIPAAFCFVFQYETTFCEWIQAYFCYFFSSFFLAGGIEFLFRAFSKGRIPPNILISIAGISLTAAFCRIQRARRRHEKRKKIRKVTLFYKGKQLECRGLLDSGNSLRTITNAPVCVIPFEEVRKLFSAAEQEYLRSYSSSSNLPVKAKNSHSTEECSEQSSLCCFPVFFSSVGTEKGMMPSFFSEKLILFDGRQSRSYTHVCIAVSKTLFQNRNYQMLIHPDFDRE